LFFFPLLILVLAPFFRVPSPLLSLSFLISVFTSCIVLSFYLLSASFPLSHLSYPVPFPVSLYLLIPTCLLISPFGVSLPPIVCNSSFAGLKTRRVQPEPGAASTDKDSATEPTAAGRSVGPAAEAISLQLSQLGEETTVKEVTDISPVIDPVTATGTAQSRSEEQQAADEKNLAATVYAAQAHEILRTQSRPSAFATGNAAPPPPVERALFSFQDLFAARPINVRASPPVQYGLNLSLARLNYEFSPPTGPTAVFAAAAANLPSFRPPAIKKASRMGIVGDIRVGDPVPVQAARHILIGKDTNTFVLNVLVI